MSRTRTVGTPARACRHWVPGCTPLWRSPQTLLLALFVFRLVRTPRRQGYARVLADLWECCRRLGLQRPKHRPVVAWPMCVARAKVGASVFRRIHAAVRENAGPDRSTVWKGLRTFAVDGS
ncbi:MAG: hypothetical protein OXN89_23585 [Bryobacterales bacterium]|nr:hypothetical protein [Bryobacterales bacterium]